MRMWWKVLIGLVAASTLANVAAATGDEPAPRQPWSRSRSR